MTVGQPGTVSTSVAGSWIDGAPVVTGGGLHQVINPATGGIVVDYALAVPTDVDRAVASARAALPGWATAIPAERSAVLAKLAQIANEHTDDLASAGRGKAGATPKRAHRRPGGGGGQPDRQAGAAGRGVRRAGQHRQHRLLR